MGKWVRLAGRPDSRLRACPEAARVTPSWRVASRESRRRPSQAGAKCSAAHWAVSRTGSWIAPFQGTSVGAFKTSGARSRRGTCSPGAWRPGSGTGVDSPREGALPSQAVEQTRGSGAGREAARRHANASWAERWGRRSKGLTEQELKCRE